MFDLKQNYTIFASINKPTSLMGYNLADKNMSEQTGQCKSCGRYFSLSILAKFGGYCSPACFQAGRQRER